MDAFDRATAAYNARIRNEAAKLVRGGSFTPFDALKEAERRLKNEPLPDNGLLPQETP